jgi:mono/diheme cytochrome c family protein
MTRHTLRLALTLSAALSSLAFAHGPNEPHEPDSPIPEAGPNEKAPTYYGEVKPILDAYCGSCHQPGGSAPFSLLNYETARAMARPILRAVENKTMPPWGTLPLDKHPMKYDMSLSPERIALIRAWVLGGAQKGNAEEEGQPIAMEASSIQEVSLVMGMNEAYNTVAAEQDEYRCFPIDYNPSESFYVTGFKVEPGNNSIVHHTTLFAYDAEYSALVDQMDASDPEYGYTCFGAPATPEFSNLPYRTIGPSASQALDTVFPEGTGILVKPGTKFVLQMHYSKRSASGGMGTQDQSRVLLQTKAQVTEALEFVYFLNPAWLAPGGMPIPAGQKEVVHEFTGRLLDNPITTSIKGELSLSRGIKIHGIGVHQHLLGKGMKIWKVDAKGVEDLIFDGVGYFTFGHQWIYQYKTPITLKPDEQVKIRCHWDNSAEKQLTEKGEKLAPIDTAWGEGTRDEMCVASLLATDL